MKLYCLKEDALIFYKSNCKHQLKFYLEPNCDKLVKSFEEDPFIETKYEICDFELDMSSEKSFQTDIENVKRVFNSLNFLSESQASDERLWAALSIKYFWKYVQYRWDISNNCTENNIKSHFFFNYHNRRSYTRNAISRLWWIGKFTIDYDNDDPYQLAEYLCKHSDFIMHLLERSQSNNKEIVKECLYALLDLEKQKIIINTDEFGHITKYLNILGSTHIVDCLPKNFIYNKIIEEVIRMKRE